MNAGPLPIAGTLPPHPRPSLKDEHKARAIFPAGQHSLPQNHRDRKGCPTEKGPRATPGVVPCRWRNGHLLDRHRANP